jgi:hypothetical protein
MIFSRRDGRINKKTAPFEDSFLKFLTKYQILISVTTVITATAAATAIAAA